MKTCKLTMCLGDTYLVEYLKQGLCTLCPVYIKELQDSQITEYKDERYGITFKPIGTIPKDSIVMLTGNSGNMTMPRFLILGKFKSSYGYIVDTDGDAITDCFPKGATHWAVPPTLPFPQE